MRLSTEITYSRLAWALGALSVFASVGCARSDAGEPAGDDPDAGTEHDGGVAHDCEVESLRVTLDLEQGEILNAAPLYFTIEQAPGALEVLASDGKVLTSVHVPDPRPFTIIAPEGPHGDVGGLETIARVIVPWPAGARQVRFGSKSLAYEACTTRARKSSTAATPRWSSGPIDERVNLLLVGEGYTAEQQGKFVIDAQRLSDEFLSQEPFQTYKGLINVWSLAAVSDETGAGRGGSHKDTAFRCAYGGNGIDRLLTCDNRRVQQAAAEALSDYDMLLVLVNDTKYGGAGGRDVATTFVGESSSQVAVHELGHQTGLDDEYGYGNDDYTDWPYPAGPNCSDSASLTPWELWREVSHVDAFPVCSRSDRFRPTNEGCRMRDNSTHGHICEVCRDYLTRWLYERVGKMASRKEPPVRDVAMAGSEGLEFSAHVVGPPASMTYAWNLGGEPLSSEGASLIVQECAPGRLLMTVEDATEWVRLGRPHVLHGGVDWLVTCEDDAPGALLLDKHGNVQLERYEYHEKYFSRATHVLIKISGTNDVDFYVAMNRRPTKVDHDDAAFGRGDDFLRYRVPRRGTLHIGVHGYEASDYHLTVERDELD